MAGRTLDFRTAAARGAIPTPRAIGGRRRLRRAAAAVGLHRRPGRNAGGGSRRTAARVATGRRQRRLLPMGGKNHARGGIAHCRRCGARGDDRDLSGRGLHRRPGDFVMAAHAGGRGGADAHDRGRDAAVSPLELAASAGAPGEVAGRFAARRSAGRPGPAGGTRLRAAAARRRARGLFRPWPNTRPAAIRTS